mmetsp:Transcript_27470/g.59647  ORF Transcript_27470/g.59647 Transcript_27470/m.59647 type:complete len:1166 (-) Transcript_27470:269-3766(-)
MTGGSAGTNPFDDGPSGSAAAAAAPPPSSSTSGAAAALASSNPFDSGYPDDSTPGPTGTTSASGGNVSDDDPAYTSGNSYSASGGRGGAGGGGTSTDESDYYYDGSDDDDRSYDDDDDDDDSSNAADPDAPVEASWQFLGDLPYRRITLYNNIQWGKKPIKDEDGGPDTYDTSSDDPLAHNGLTSVPMSYLESQRRTGLDEADLRQLLSKTTTTKVAGCPNGGPIAAITCGTTAALSTSELRIMTASGRPLANVAFPPRSLAHNPQKPIYTSSDVLTIGFTDRFILVVVMRDSLCLTYDLSGNAILPPFHIIPEEYGSKRGPGSAELMEATVYGGGVAVLSTAMSTALVELLDEHDDPAYADGAHIAARRINPEGHANGGGGGGGPPDLMATNTGSVDSVEGGIMLGSARAGVLPPYWAIVTPMPTAAHAQKNYYSYCTIAVLARNHTANGHPEVFLSTSDNSVLIVDSTTGEITDVDCRARMQSPIVAMSFAPNGRFLACFTQNSLLTVISTTFETKVLDFDTSEGSSAPPKDMKWCGEDSVVLHWKNLGVLMVGPYGDWLRFPYEGEENLHIIPEIDCCRVVTNYSMEMLQRVPPATAELFRIGSIEPSAMLLDASDDFEKGAPSSDEAARAITKTGMLADAIIACTEAATREFDIKTQKRLLTAASYGMHFSYKDGSGAVMGGPLTGSPPEAHMRPTEEAANFVASARKIRVMNALRDSKVGLVLTSSQYDAITPTGIIARLIAMKRPALATSICSYLQLDESVQSFARASRAAAYVISDSSKGQTDGQTAEAAINILNEDSSDVGAKGSTIPEEHNRGAFASVALAADRAGRGGVARLLLMRETSTADKVPALLSIGLFADAASVAVAAKDTDLTFLCLVEFQKYCKVSADNQKQAMSTFNQTLVTKFPAEAVNLYMMYLASNQDVKYMMNLYLRKEKFVAAGSAMSKLALDTENTKERIAMVKEASRVYGLGKESVFQKVSADEYIDLLSEQERLRSTYGSYDVAPESSSITTTISSVIRYAGTKPREAHRLFADAERLAKRYKVPEKRLWYIRVRAFSQSGQWANLRNLADSRAKNPIGLKPFALAAIEGKQPLSEITRYIERVPPGEERYDLFCEAKMWQKAVEEAVNMRDPNRIMHVRSLCNSPEIQQLCEEQARML